MPVNHLEFDPIAVSLRSRTELIANQTAAAEVDLLVATRRDKWSKQQQAPGVSLTYARGRGDAIDLLQSPESGPWTDFTAPNSLREVEVGANLRLREDDPSDDPTAPYPDPRAAASEDVTLAGHEGRRGRAGATDLHGGEALASEDADEADADVVLEESVA